MTSHESDEELLLRMSGGDEEAFGCLYRRRQAAIYRFAVQMSGSFAVAEDVTQEVFMALIKGASGFAPEKGSLAGYLYGIARNHVLRRIDRDRFLVPMDDGEDATSEAEMKSDDADDPLTAMTRNETVETVRSAVLALPVHYREVIVLCELHEMSYIEAAAALGCAVGTVRSRLHRARALLVDKLKGGEDANRSRGRAAATRCFA